MIIQAQAPLIPGIKDSFSSSGVNPEVMTIILWVLTIAGIILVVGILAKIILARMRRNTSPARLDDPQKIMALLGRCLAERSRFELSFRQKLIKNEGIFCSLVSVHSEEILLELPSYVTPRQTWIGRPMEIYFSVASRGDARIYYIFESSIEAIDSQHSGQIFLRIARPDVINLGQRRMHFRLVPDNATISEASLWFAQDKITTKNHTGPDAWGEPLAHRHLLAQEEDKPSLAVLDISAGGCRLSIKDSEAINEFLEQDASPDVLLFFRLLDRESGHLEAWLQGKIRVIVCDPLNNTRSMGIEFMMNGRLEGKTDKHIIWTPLYKDEGHPHIGNWVFKQHLALFRQQEKERKEAWD